MSSIGPQQNCAHRAKLITFSENQLLRIQIASPFVNVPKPSESDNKFKFEEVGIYLDMKISPKFRLPFFTPYDLMAEACQDFENLPEGSDALAYFHTSLKSLDKKTLQEKYNKGFSEYINSLRDSGMSDLKGLIRAHKTINFDGGKSILKYLDDNEYDIAFTLIAGNIREINHEKAI